MELSNMTNTLGCEASMNDDEVGPNWFGSALNGSFGCRHLCRDN